MPPTNLTLFKRSNGIYYIVDRRSEMAVWKSTGKTVKDEAKKVLREYHELHPLDLSPKPGQRIRLYEFQHEFDEFAKQNYATGSREIFASALMHLRRLTGDVYLDTMTMRNVDSYKTIRLQTVSPVSVNIELRALRTFLTTAVRWGYLEKNPFGGMKLVTVPDKTPKYLEPGEYDRLYAAIGQQWLREVVFFAVHTGARRSEIVNLKWTGVNLGLQIVSFESDGGFRVKAGKRRSVPLSEEVFQQLQRLEEKRCSEYVFTLKNRRIGANLVTQKFKKCVRRAGLSNDLRFHSLRATFASWLVMRGAPICSVSKLLGHSEVTTTQRYYAHLEPDTLHDVVQMI